jgi:hypothetical protein
MRPPGPNDQIVGNAGNATVYRRPDGSEYALDHEGRGGEGKTSVHGPAQFDSRSKYPGGGGDLGGLGIILVILFPLAIIAGVGWVLYHIFKWVFDPEAENKNLRVYGTLAVVITAIVAISIPMFQAGERQAHAEKIRQQEELVNKPREEAARAHQAAELHASQEQYRRENEPTAQEQAASRSKEVKEDHEMEATEARYQKEKRAEEKRESKEQCEQRPSECDY